MKNKIVFDEFQPISSKQWKQKIQFELNGADYNKSLIWNSPEDIQVKPFYHRDEYSKNRLLIYDSTDFKICQNVFVQDLEKSNFRAINSIKSGAESIRFTIINEEIEISKLLQNLPLESISIYFNLSFLSLNFIKKTVDFLAEKNAKIYFNFDPIGHLAKDGNWHSTTKKSNFEVLNEINDFFNQIDKNKINNTATSTFSFININTSLYQNSGATIVQQIAYSLAHANEYFNLLKNINQPIVFEVSVGTNYFFEIAKLRAMRMLFQIIAKEYNHNLDCQLIVTPTKRNKTVYNSQLNLIRSSTECMSAILGGANAISNLAYDFLFKKDNKLTTNLSINQLLLLKNEPFIDNVMNPAAGSYYIESLTQQLAEKSLALFKEIESNGGFLKQLKSGIIKKKIDESAQKEQKNYDFQKDTPFNANEYFKNNEMMKEAIEIYPFTKIKHRKTLISPLIEHRLAEKSEQKRLKNETNF